MLVILLLSLFLSFFFFFNDTATTEIYTLSLHDALPISDAVAQAKAIFGEPTARDLSEPPTVRWRQEHSTVLIKRDRKSTRLNSSHANISYAVFCLKKKKKKNTKSPYI